MTIPPPMEIEGAWCGAYFESTYDFRGEHVHRLDRKDPVLIVVSGPDRDDEICLMAAPETYLPSATAEALMRDLARRLGFGLTQGLAP